VESEHDLPWVIFARAAAGFGGFLILEYQKSSAPKASHCAGGSEVTLDGSLWCQPNLKNSIFLSWVLAHHHLALQPAGVVADFWYPSMRRLPLPVTTRSAAPIFERGKI